MGTRITALVNDHAALPRLAAEHGLSLWIEHDGHAILFDTGASGSVLAANAEALGVRLEDAEAVCLSHGHFDHTGGLGHIIARLAGADLYAHPGVFVPKYARRAGGWQQIGIGLSREAIEAAGVRVHLSEGPQEVCAGAVLTGEVARAPRLVPSTPHLYAEGADGPEVDPFADDLAIVLRVDDGLVVVSGCAHAGIINHCRAAKGRGVRDLLCAAPLGPSRQGVPDTFSFRAVIGGFHLVGASAELLHATIEGFRELGPRAIHPCHCTGDAATSALTAAFPGLCHPIAAGSVLEF